MDDTYRFAKLSPRYLTEGSCQDWHRLKSIPGVQYVSVPDGAIIAPLVARALLDHAPRRDGGMSSIYDNYKNVPCLCSPTSIKSVSYRGGLVAATSGQLASL